MRVGWKLPSTNHQIASVRFRGLTPLRSLRARGMQVELFDPAMTAKYDVVILSKTYDPAHVDLAKRLKGNRQKVIFDLSDNHFYNPKGLKQYVEAATNLDRMLAQADVITTCSTFLAEIVRGRPSCKSNVAVVEDAVEPLDVVRGNSRKAPAERLRMLWFGSHGSPNSDSGLADLARLKSHLKEVTLPADSLLTVMSNNRAAFQKHEASIGMPARYLDWDQDKFSTLLSSTDVVVLPITPTPFSNSKSNNRLATALWFGIPVIADEIPAYSSFERFAYLNDWKRGFEDVIGCRPEVDARIASGMAFARAHCNDQVVADQWMSAIKLALGDKSVSVQAAENPAERATKPPGAIEPQQVAPAAHKDTTGQKDLRDLKSLPQRSRLLGLPLEPLLSKLKIERGLYDGPEQPAATPVCFIVAVDKSGIANLGRTLSSLKLQSFAGCRVLFLASEISTKDLAKAVSECGLASGWTLANSADELKTQLRENEMCMFVRCGDAVDASAALIISAYGQKYDFVAFSHATLSGSTCELAVQILDLDRLTHDNVPIVGNAFAVRSHWLKSYPGDLEREFRINDMHVFQIWSRRDPKLRSVAHPEYLLFRDKPLAIKTRAWFEDYSEAYERLLEESGAFRMVRHLPSDPCPFHLVPAIRPNGVSVLIPFRDKAEMTMEAVRSVANSSSALELEVILINNNSAKASIEAVARGLATLPDLSTRIVDYPYPFNHSAQMNLGARSAKYDVVVFMNNDCTIETPRIFDDMSAWAMLEGIGTVGARIVNPQTAGASLGIVKRLASRSFYDSPTEEMYQPPAFQSFSRRVFGNTFAFTAMSRERFLALSGLDTLYFPVGYNDVALAAKCAQSGLRNLCLGHLVVSHSPGQSREGTEETTQKIFLKTLLSGPIEGYREDYVIEPSLQGRSVYYP